MPSRKKVIDKAQTNLEHLSASMLEDGGPVIVGVGVTNIPHLPLPPMSVVEKDGVELVRVPFLRKGIFRHPDGDLVFDDGVFNKMLENHQNKVSEWGVGLKVGHIKEKTDALAWFDIDEGGLIVRETDPKYGELLVGYGKPTGTEATDLIKNKKYKFASVEFKPKYRSTLMKQLSADVLTEISKEDLSDITSLEELKMEVTITQEEYDALKSNESKVTQLEEQLQTVQATLTSAQAKVVELEAKVKPEPKELELPETVKLEMAANREEIARLKRKALESDINAVIAQAETYRDSNGYGHSPIFLELARAAMLGAEVKDEDVVIKLESSKPADIADYFRKVWMKALKTVPGQVKMVGKTEADDNRSVALESTTFTSDEIKAFWAEAI